MIFFLRIITINKKSGKKRIRVYSVTISVDKTHFKLLYYIFHNILIFELVSDIFEKFKIIS